MSWQQVVQETRSTLLHITEYIHRVCANIYSYYVQRSLVFLKVKFCELERVFATLPELGLQWKIVSPLRVILRFWYPVVHITDHLPPWRRVLLEKLIVAQLVNKFSVFYGIRSFITVFTRARHWSLF
jgi:hypothetical protein